MSATASRRKAAGPWWALLGLLVAIAGAGCGGRVGQVSGTVSYRGRPLPDGTVLLLAGDGRPYDGRIGADGRFAITGVPPGQARVAVTSLAAGGEGQGRGGRAPAAAPVRRADRPANLASRIPPRYGDLGQSGLTVSVDQDTRLDLDLQ